MIGHFLTPHTCYTHTHFCSKMAISIAITKPISKPEKGAKKWLFFIQFNFKIQRFSWNIPSNLLKCANIILETETERFWIK